MSKRFKIIFNRREFMKRGLVVITTTTGLGFVTSRSMFNVMAAATQPVPGDAVDEIMHAAASVCTEIKDLLKNVHDELAASRKKAAKAAEEVGGVYSFYFRDVINRVIAVVIKIIVCVGSPFSESSSLALIEDVRRIEKALKDADLWEADIRKQKKMTKELETAIRDFRSHTDNAKDTAVACNVYGHVATDRKYAARLVDAARTQKLDAVAEVLKVHTLGRKVVVREAKQDNEFFISVQMGTLTHCLSTNSTCGGKLFSITK